jgi:hypothetical protein
VGRPVTGYYTKAGERVPSVTEVLGKFKNADPLVGWAFKLGKESGIAQAQGRPAPRSAYEVKTQAAQAGQIAHDMLECYLNKTVYVYEGPKLPFGVMDRAVRGFENGRNWMDRSKYVVCSTEYSIVSERHRFGGTYDALLKYDGKWYLGDWKTSNAIYADYLIQVAAYAILCEENQESNGQPFSISGYDILRFSKEYADFEHKHFTDLSDAKAAFLLMLQLYPLVTKLEDRV